MCQDKAVSYLNVIRYNPILLPREAFDPLMVLGGPPGDLRYLGSLDDLVQSPAAPPTIERDDPASNVSDRRTSKLDAKAGFDLLGRLLKALGSAVGASAKAEQMGGWEIVLLNVLHDFVAPLRLGGYLGSKARLRDGIKDMLSQYEAIYLVTETLKSNQFGIVAYDSSNTNAQVSADAIKDVISVTASIEVTHGSGNVLCYRGQKQLRFAFRALPLQLSPGATNPSLGVPADALTARAVGNADEFPLDAFPVLAADQLIDVKFA
jgi:hypothetical protein